MDKASDLDWLGLIYFKGLSESGPSRFFLLSFFLIVQNSTKWFLQIFDLLVRDSLSIPVEEDWNFE